MQLMTFSEPIGQINAISISYQFSYSCCEHAVPNETDTTTVSIVEWTMRINTRLNLTNKIINEPP